MVTLVQLRLDLLGARAKLVGVEVGVYKEQLLTAIVEVQ